MQTSLVWSVNKACLKSEQIALVLPCYYAHAVNNMRKQENALKTNRLQARFCYVFASLLPVSRAFNA
jgi:hypothetical protein